MHRTMIEGDRPKKDKLVDLSSALGFEPQAQSIDTNAIMPNWIIKAVIHKSISLLPYKHKLNHLIQNLIGSQVLHARWFEAKLDQCNNHLEYLLRFNSRKLEDVSTLELGTGWQPIIPIGLFLCGLSDIRTIDEAPHTKPERVHEVLRFFLEYADNGTLKNFLPLLKEDRVERVREVFAEKSGRSASELLAQLSIESVVGDAQAMPLSDGTVDFFVSNNTLEHIPEDVLYGIYREFRRLASPQSIMSHFIDMSDHYAHFDHSITPYNFLKFSTGTWKLIDNSVRILNRLRIGDYRKLHQETGFTVLFEEHEVGSSGMLATVRLAKPFQHLHTEELLITHCWIISAPNSN